MLKVGRYQPQKIQSSHLKLREKNNLFFRKKRLQFLAHLSEMTNWSASYRGQLCLSSYVLVKAAVFLNNFFARFARSFETEGKRKLLSFSTIPLKLRRLHLGRIWLTLPLCLKLPDWLNSSKAHMARNKTRNASGWTLHKNRIIHPKEQFFITT